MLKIYIASSWRNPGQQEIVKLLREHGYKVYDFKNPKLGNTGFNWSEIDENWQDWTSEEFYRNLHHPLADYGYELDKKAMDAADVCVMVLPCGKSASLEAGYFAGAKKPLAILLSECDSEPELMFKLANQVCCSYDELLEWLDDITIMFK